MSSSSVGGRAGRRVVRMVALLVVSALAVLGLATPVLAYQVNTAAWTGGTGAGATNTVTQPSGLVVTATVGGTNVTIPSTGDTLATAVPTSSMFSPPLPTSTPSVRLSALTGTSSSPPCDPSGTCTNRGTLTIGFSQPTTNPILHVAGLGSVSLQSTNGTVTNQSQHSSTYRLTGSTPAGATLSGPSAGSTNLTVTSTSFRPTNPSAASRCSSPNDPAGSAGDPAPAAATAGCGSITVNGTVTSLTFAVDVVNVITVGNGVQLPNSGDGISMAITTREDFGDAPDSFETGNAAMAVLSDIRLGTAVSEDNATVPNATTSPNTADTGDDGVTLPPLLTGATSYVVPVTLSGASKSGQVCGWVDFNRNGTFEAAERACATVSAGQTAATLTFTGLTGLTAGATYARFRVGYNTTQVQSPTGRSDSGEVEDYTLSIILPPNPDATNDTATTPYEVPVQINPVTNDTPGVGTTFTPSSVRLLDAGGNAVTTLTTTAGTYVVNTTTGVVTFTPAQGFTGTAPAVNYRVTDTLGRTATATITVTVTPPGPPVANPDTATTPFNTAVSTNLSTNDTASAANDPLVPGSVRLVNTSGALVTTLTNSAGTYVVNTTTGVVTFTPVAGFSGTAPAVTYSIADEAGQRDTSTYTVTVGAPPPPAATPDTGTTPQNVDITVNPAANDTPGTSGAAIVPNTVRLLDGAGNPVTTLTVTGQGTYTVNTATGAVTFDPVATFTGTATAVPYRVADANGATASSTITITVTPVTPTAANDTATTPFNTSVTSNVLANDAGGSAAAPLVPSSLRLVNGAGTLVTTLTTAAGTYTANADGTITFAPAAGFSGTAPAVTYSIADANGTRVTATYTVTVTAPAPPAANPDTGTTPQNTPITVNPAANDTPGTTGAAIVPASVRLLDGAGNPVTTLTVAGQGTYAVNTATGAVTFTPVATFTGTATAVPYRVADANGATATSTIRITVTPVTPVANPDTATTPFNTAVTTTVVTNDTPGSATAPLVPSSLRLVDAGGALVGTLTTAAGTYTANADGSITFTPATGFTGTAPAVTYSIADSNGTRATTTYTVTVAGPAPPVANPDTRTTPQNTPVSLNPSANDAPGPTGAAIVATSPRLLDANGLSVTTLTVAGQGTYTVDTTSGVITFTPLPGFTGTATAVPYRVTDTNGATARSTITITVTAVTPAAANDTATTPFNTAVTSNVLGNDAPGSATAPLVPSSVRLVGAGGALVSTLTTAAGTYTANADGTITFTPAAGFQGAAPAVTYSVADANGTRVTATYTVTVGAPAAPVANPDTGTTPQNTPITVPPATNDTAGPTGAAIVPSTLRLLDAGGNPVTTLTNAQGTYTVDTGTGAVTFAPVPAFTGTATPVPYRIADANGATATSTITITVTAITPTAANDTATTPFNTTVTSNVLTNDAPGAASAPLVPSSLRLVGAGGALVTTLTNAAGTYTANADGTITFAPVAGFQGVAPAVTYSIADANGTRATATYTVTVAAPQPPAANPDTGTTPQNTPITLNPAGNDTPGPSGAAIVPASVRLLDAGGNPVTTLTNAQGTYAVDTATGAVTFTPVAGFTGTATAVPYRVADANGATATSTIRITVTAVTPTANPDTTTTPFSTPVTSNVLGNDTPGSAAAPLVPSSVRLVNGAGALVSTLTTTAGTYVANPDGTISFQPTSTFQGTAPAVTYSVADANGTRTTSTYTVTVLPPASPNAVPDTGTTPQNVPVTVNPAANDTPGPTGAAIVPATVRLIDGTGTLVTTLTVAGQGTYTVNTTTGAVTFTPVATFTGTATAVPYRVFDTNGASADSTITITVGSVIPVANPDTASTPFQTAVTSNVVGNDTPGAPSAPIAPATLRLVNAAGALVTTLTNSAGSYTANADGTITFTPAAGFQGVAPAVRYSIADTNGTRAQSTYTVTVAAPAPPVANPDTGTTPQNVDITVNPAANDAAGPTGAAIVPGTVRLLDAGGNPVTTLTNAQGTYTVNTSTGAVTFDPVATFTGTATAVPYRVADANGATATSTITITVTAVTPAAANDTATTVFNTPVTTNVLTNDTAGSAAAPLVPSSLRLVGAGGALVQTLTTAAGTYTANADGTITFTPVAGFQGVAPPVTYSIADANTTRVTATYTVTVAAPAPPRATADTGTTPQNTPITVNPAANDTPGTSGAAIVPASVRLLNAAGNPVTTLTNAQGTYAVNTGTGAVTFTPVATFTGTATPVPYRVTDANGATATSTITITVTAVTPTANPDTRAGTFNTPLTVDVLTNDTAGSAAAPLVPSSVRLVGAGGALVGTLTTAAGTYVANADGTITFTPVTGFQGAAPAVTYSVADANGTRTTTTLTVTIAAPAAPVANPDTGTTPQGTPITVTPPANDTPGPTGAALVPASVRLLDSSGNPVTTLTVNGEGTYAVNTGTGAVTFTPVATFTGTATPVPYRITDTNGATAASTVTITVTAVTPAANPDTATTAYATPVTTDVLANDAAGNAATPLVANTLRLVNPAGVRVTTLATAAGTYTANADGTITFTPAAGFQGAAPPVTYSIADANGTRAQSTYTVTVAAPVPPVANPDTATTPQNVDVTVNPAANDAAGPSGAAIVPSTLRLLNSVGNPVTTLTTAEGTYTVNTTTGAVTFDPVATFSGVATAVPYRIADANGATATSTITITVTAVTPTAAPDTATTPFRTPVTTSVIGNDTPGAPSAPLVPSSLRLVGPGGTLVTSLTTAAGTYAAAADGAITFTPDPAFQGTAPPVTYSIADANGTRATSTYTVTVSAPVPPAANPDLPTTQQNVPATINPLANDTPGPSGAALVPSSVRLLDAAGNPVTTLTVPGQGTYAVNPDGTVTFTPVATFSGEATAVPYRVADANGATATSTIRFTVTAVTPTAAPDTAQTHHNQPVTTNVLANDAPGAAGAPLVPASLRLVAGNGALVTTVTTGQGTFTANANGTITFAPANVGFTGDTPPQAYSVADTNGTRVTSTYTVTVYGPPAAQPDTATTPQNTPVVLTPLVNDTPSQPIPGEPNPPVLVPSTLRLIDPVTGADTTSVTLPGVGTYTADANGTVTFTPVASFTGTTQPVGYYSLDSNGEDEARSTLTVTVTAVIPDAIDDDTTTPFGNPVTTNVLANDVPGSVAAPLVPSSLRLVGPGGALVTTLTTPAGTYAANPDGTITYTPAAGFTGEAPEVTYSVADANGTRDTATYGVVVGTPPVARPDVATGLQAQPVTVNVLENDSPGVDGNGVEGTLDPASVRLVGAGGALVTTLTVPGVGTYSVNPNGSITFTPVNTFTGTAPPVTYQVTGSFGNTTRSTLTITSNPAAPEAEPDTATTPQNVNVTVNPAANDLPGATGAAIAPASVRLLDGAGNPVTTLTTAAGTYTVDTATGAVTFDPVPGFVGTTAPVPYRVADVNGVTADSTITITVTAVTPDAEPDAAVTPANVPVTIAVLGNDTPGSPAAPLDPTSVRLVDPATGAEVTTLALAGVGTFTVNATTGAVTFTPAAGFTGSVPTVDYRVADANGTVAESSISVTVGTGPVAAPDQPTTLQGQPVTFDPLANDNPGSGGAALDPATVRLIDPATGNPVTTVTLPGQGTFTVNPNGTITFTPVPTFTGDTVPPVSYRVADTNGAVATGAIQVTVQAAPPTANPDTTGTPQGDPVTIDPLANDTAGASGAALDRSTVRLLDPVTGNPVTSVTIPGEGTFTVNPANGLVTFTPLPTFTGGETVGYQVADANGTVVRSTITVTVDALVPTPAPDTATTPGGTPVTTNVLANDTADPDAPLVPSTLRLVAPGGALVTTLGTAAGTYEANADGTITFTPAAGFSGTAPAVTYSIADDNGTRATSTYTVTVGAGATAAPDAPTTTQGAPVTFDPLANDDPGEDGAGNPGTFVPGTLRLLDAAGNPVTTLGVPGVGTYAVNPDGTVTFTPLPGFTGTAPAVTYQVQNSFGATASSTITVTVTAVTGTANPDTATTAQNVTVTTNVVANDTPGSATVPLVPSSLRLVGPGGSLVGTLTVPGVGVYTANADGSITFDPVATFTGPAPAVTYSVADANGTRVTSTYTVTVTAVTPVANPDTAGTPLGDPVTVDVLANDTPGAPGAALVPGSVRLVGAGGGLVTTLTTAAGTYAVNPDGTITFTPAAGFTGPAPAVTYSVADANGTRVTSTLTVTVGAGATAAPDTGATLQGVAVTVPVLANDTPGDDGTGTPGTLVPATLRLLDAGGSPVTTLTVPGVGTYTANPSGTITFTPVPGFTGTAPAVAYQVADSFGNVATGSLTVTVAPAAPATAPDNPTTGQGQPVTFNPAANDGPGASGAAIVPSSVRLLDAAGNPVTTLTVPGVGTYTVNPATGAVTFTPVPGFTGTAPPVTYRVLDANGVPGTSTITVTVTAITPVARPDSAVTPAGAPVTVNVLGNDSAGDPAEPLDPTSVRLIDPATGTPVTTLALAGVGTFTVNTTTGAVTFTPAAGFTGAVPPVTYQVADANGTVARSTLSITVGTGPVARPDSPTTTQGLPVTFDPLANDSPGSGGAALDPTTVRLIDPATGNPVTTLAVAGVGTFTVNTTTGAVTVTPVPGFTGVTPPVTYQVADANGVLAQSAIQVTVAAAPPTANPDSATTPQGVPVTLNPAANDTEGASGADLDPASVFLLDPATGTYVRTVTLAGVGTFVVNPATGAVTFTPVPAFTGTTPPVTYRIADANGSTATSTITVVVGPVVPVARPDTATTGQDVTVRTNVLGNDSPGDPADPLVPATLRLVDGNGALVTTLTVPGVGTYTANPDGTITFDPVPAFTGTAPAVTYSVADANGTRVTSTYTVTVAADAPQAVDDAVTTPAGTPVRIPVLGNDDGGSAGLDPATLHLIDPVSGLPVDSVTVAGVGTWTVNDDGTVTFTPAPGFSGDATIDYQVADAQGRITTATITVTVQAPTTPPTTTPPSTTPPSTGPVSPGPTSPGPTSPAPTSPGATAPPAPTPPPLPGPNPPGGGLGPLPNTGAAVLGVVGIGLLALVGGTVLAVASRRRRRDEVDAGLDIRDE